jgi:hypothetical protein
MEPHSQMSYLHLWRATSWPAMYTGIGLFTAASALLQIGPHISRYFGLDTTPEYQVPIYTALGLVSYICYSSAFRRISMRNSEKGPSMLTALSRSPRALLSGLLALVTSRAVVMTLQSNLSAKSELIPF